MKKNKLFIALLATVSVPAFCNAQVVTADSLEFNAGVYADPSYLLRGTVAGVRVSATESGESSVVRTDIRGLNSLRGSAQPLWIIDGVVLTSSSGQIRNAFWQDEYSEFSYMTPLSQLNGVNLYDIKSIEVLNNATATALYGSRGANGVIIVNMKTPDKEKFSFNWHSNVGVTTPTVENLKSKFIHNHSFSLGSKVGNGFYNVSAFFRKTDNPVSGSGCNALGARLKFETRGNKVIWFGMNATVSVQKQLAQTTTQMYGAPSMGLALRGIEPNGYYNTVEGWSKDYDDYSDIYRGSGAAWLQVNFLPVLKWKTDLSFDYQSASRYIWYGAETEFGLQQNRAAGMTVGTLFDYNLKSVLDYTQYVAEKHKLHASAGVELNGNDNRYNIFNGANYFTDILRVKGFSLKESPNQSMWMHKDYRTFSAMADLGYDYSDIAGIHGSIRFDRNLRYDDAMTMYPSASAYFDIANAFFKDSKAVSSLRLEGGWGASGATGYIAYPLVQNYAEISMITAALLEKGYLVTENIQNLFDGFTRVYLKEGHVSINAGFIDNRIKLGLTAYSKESTDNFNIYCFGRYVPMTDPEIWRATDKIDLFQSCSKISNKGIEGTIEVVPVLTQDWKWSVRATAAFNRNELLEVGEADACATPISDWGLYCNRNVVGSQVGAIYGVKNFNEDGTPNYQVLGNSTPKAFGGVSTTLSWKGLTLDAIADWATGHSLLDLNRMIENRQVYATLPYVKPADFFRLSRLSLGYNFNLNSKVVKGLKLTATGTNLFTATAYEGFNPDVNSFGASSNMSLGLDYGSLPIASSFILGVNIIF